MPKITLALAAVLIVLGLVAFIATGLQHFTALIPTAFGFVFGVFGVLGLTPSVRRHAMHAAAVLGLLGFFGALPGLLKLPALLAGEAVARPAAVVAQSAMALCCAVYVALAVKSFVDARLRRS